MKKTVVHIVFFLLISTTTLTQTAFQNNGNVQMHTGAQVGFHTNLVNNGIFDNNLGFTGFYSNDILTVSGANRAIFNNVEVGVLNNLELYTSLGVKNELSFLEGKVTTPRNNTSVSLDFINHNFYVGEGNSRHVDGYTSVMGVNEFTFPIGDDDRLRPMILPSQANSAIFKGAYFFEDPNTPSTFSTNFNTTNKQVAIKNVSNLEFWDLNGNNETTITLTWDDQSNIASLSEELKNLRVVGWNKTSNIWEDLGNTNVTGTLTNGAITSTAFIPNDYEVITIGSITLNLNNNFLISPNNDNINDNLVFEELEQYKTSKLTIYNRWGNVVFKIDNYKNNWKGFSEGRATFIEKEGLPVGTYFYILQYGNNELNRMKKGWVYINR